MSIGNLEELVDENHAIVSSSAGMEYYVRILSFVDKDQLELDFAILMHNKSIDESYHVTSDEKLSQSPKAHHIRQK
ncbi:hypothetical protein C4D60_Mb04t12250 [Musa balbisiana]|uniref:Proteasomal ATPase second OB domain-containing protein n=1 Tax=Musa balbisiana TaxID=52838 RepID=A0A4S8KBJ4_MUSBA|nr:hypothetical protein C4D60_Mb04t12250 [Musa balbisiana]